nr:caspase family protein [Novosphingobium sp. SG919]
MLVLGAGHYPNAQQAKAKVPKLADIGSAAQSAIDFATNALTDWHALFEKPVASVDVLINDAANPDGITFACPGVDAVKLEAPTLANIIAARSRWLENATRDDILIFYCCGHGIWLPSVTRTFLASDFGADPESVWPNAISIDLFIEGMGDKAPRQQWLIFDCCANQAPPALRNARPAANALVEAVDGLRLTMMNAHGPLAQAVIASSSVGARAFGRTGGRSRFMDVFIDACADAGFSGQGDDGRWQVSVQGLEAAMSTYRFRVAALEDRAYYTFARLTTSDAEEPPVLMVRDNPPTCTLLVTSEPPIRLRQCVLDIMRGGIRIDGQQPGPAAEERFRRLVEAYDEYEVNAAWPAELGFPAQNRKRRALPPLAEVKL